MTTLIAEMVLPGQSACAQARRVHLLSVRYAGSAWRHDRGLEAMPPHYHGKASALLWMAFKSGAPMPICERQLRKLLARRLNEMER